MELCPYMSKRIQRGGYNDYFYEQECYKNDCQAWNNLAEKCGEPANVISNTTKIITTNPSHVTEVDNDDNKITITANEDLKNVKDALYAVDGSNQSYKFYDDDDNELTDDDHDLQESDYLVVTAENGVSEQEYTIEND